MNKKELEQKRKEELEKLKNLNHEPHIIKGFTDAQTIILAIMITISIVGMLIMWL